MIEQSPKSQKMSAEGTTVKGKGEEAPHRPFWKKKRLFLPIVFFGLFLFLYFWVWFPTYSWNQRLTIEVETPDGLKTGTSVVNAWVTLQPFGFPGLARWRGEAVVVDLGDDKYLFATLDHPVNLMAETSSKIHPGCSTRWVCNFKKMKSRTSGARKLQVPKNAYPTLVTFDDVNNPASVREVYPDDLSATFGDGYSLRSMTLELTSDQVTEGNLKKVLVWQRSIPDEVWRNNLSGKQRDLLSIVRWVRE